MWIGTDASGAGDIRCAISRKVVLQPRICVSPPEKIGGGSFGGGSLGPDLKYGERVNLHRKREKTP
jgi:hypothetical protein